MKKIIIILILVVGGIYLLKPKQVKTCGFTKNLSVCTECTCVGIPYLTERDPAEIKCIGKLYNCNQTEENIKNK